MEGVVKELGGRRVLVCTGQEASVAGPQAAADLISLAWDGRASVVAIQVHRLSERFFDLRTGLAGAMAQKFVNYHIHLAILGDVSTYSQRSEAFRDFVYEANRGSAIWFASDEEALAAQLSAMA